MSLPAITSDTEVLVREAALIYAYWVNAYELVVYRSPLVRDTDPVYRRVRDLLNDEPHTIKHSAVLEDPDMMFGHGLLSVYEIWGK